MKKQLLHLVLLALFGSASAATPGKAQFNLHCVSLRFQPGTTTSLGLRYNLDLTTDSSAASTVNGELAPLPVGAPSSHGCYYRLGGDIFFEPVSGSFFLNLPEARDDNTNAIADFFEVSQAVSAVTTIGTFEDFERSGKITTTWSREANSKSGTCRLNMDGYGLTFNLTYEILEFIGTLNYTTSATNVVGFVTLTNTLTPSKRLSGRVDFAKVTPDRLSLGAGSWTDETGRSTVFFGSEELDRHSTNYVNSLGFKDGDLTTSVEDYAFWLLRISDSNDANGNGIPDLSDVPVPRSPSLGVSLSNRQLLFSVRGEVGKRHEIERVSALGKTNWVLATSLTLTNDPQTATLPVPTNGIGFWRVKVP